MTYMEFFYFIIIIIIIIFSLIITFAKVRNCLPFFVLFKSVKTIGKLVLKKTTEVQEKKLSGSYSHLDKHSPK